MTQTEKLISWTRKHQSGFKPFNSIFLSHAVNQASHSYSSLMSEREGPFVQSEERLERELELIRAWTNRKSSHWQSDSRWRAELRKYRANQGGEIEPWASFSLFSWCWQQTTEWEQWVLSATDSPSRTEHSHCGWIQPGFWKLHLTLVFIINAWEKLEVRRTNSATQGMVSFNQKQTSSPWKYL